MAGRPPKPIELLVCEGKKHLTKAEIKKRKNREVKAPSDRITAPSYLTISEKAEFSRIAKCLKDLNIISNLDCDCLARYIQSETKYKAYDKMITDYMRKTKEAQLKTGKPQMDIKILSGLENLRDKTIKQCRASASDLGLTISSRCRLTVPKAEEKEDPNKDMFE